jgi:integrase
MLRQIIRVAKFWREYAGAAIDDKVMREFIPWWRDYYSQLQKNAKLHPIGAMTSWACQQMETMSALSPYPEYAKPFK